MSKKILSSFLAFAMVLTSVFSAALPVAATSGKGEVGEIGSLKPAEQLQEVKPVIKMKDLGEEVQIEAIAEGVPDNRVVLLIEMQSKTNPYTIQKTDKEQVLDVRAYILTDEGAETREVRETLTISALKVEEKLSAAPKIIVKDNEDEDFATIIVEEIAGSVGSVAGKFPIGSSKATAALTINGEPVELEKNSCTIDKTIDEQTVEVKAVMMKDGKEVSEVAKETVTISAYYEAEIDGQRYATFAEAVKAAPKNTEKTITLMQDVTASVMIGHQYVQNIIVDLNGHTMSYNGIVLTAYRSGTVLTVKNGTIKGNSTSGSLRATYNGTLILGEDLTVLTSGGSANAIYVDNGTVNIEKDSVVVKGGKADIATKAGGNATIAISAGSFKYEVKPEHCAEGYEPTAHDDGTYGVKEIPAGPVVAMIGEAKYASLNDAIAAAVDGDVIVVMDNITVGKDDAVLLDNKFYTFFKVERKTVTIDLNGKTVTGSAAGMDKWLVGMFSTENNGHLTLTGDGTVELTASGATVYSLIANYEPGCTIIVENGSYKLDYASDSLMYTGGNEGIIVKDGTFVLGNVGTGTNQQPWIFNALKSNENHVLVSGGSFNADVLHQFWIHEVEAPADKALVESEDGMYTFTDAAAYVTQKAFGYDKTVGYVSLQDAFAAIKGDAKVVLLANASLDETDLVDLDGYHTFLKVDGKNVTVDLNGYNIYADASKVTDNFVLGVFSTANGGHLTLNGEGTVQGYSGATQEEAFLDPAKGNKDYNYKFYTLLASYNDDCTITVNGGNYVLDYAGDSLAYTSGNEGIIVNGGTFKVGNLGGIRNGMPWVFNARGQNARHVVVNGGSFCADIQHQYYPFEVELPKEKALKKDENGMYTVVKAVAYVNEQVWNGGRWYTNNVGYASLEEALAAAKTPAAKNNKAPEQVNVYVIGDYSSNEELVIPATFTGTLYLNNAKLSSISAAETAKIEISGNVIVKNENGSAITGKKVYLSGKGTLTAIANGDHAYGIGGDNTEEITINDLTIVEVKGGRAGEIGKDTKYYKDAPEGGAAIGSGYNGAVITLNNVTIADAQGGSKAAGIGARFWTGVTININNSRIKKVEGGANAAAIGGSRVSSGAKEDGVTINIVNSTIDNAVGGVYGAGIGSGYDTHCQAGQPICTINIEGSTINATGGQYAAGVGTGYHNAGLAGEIKNSTVKAVSGEKYYKDIYTQAQDIGFGVVDPGREGSFTPNASIIYNDAEIKIPAAGK